MLKWLMRKRDVRNFDHKKVLRENLPPNGVAYALGQAIPLYERMMRRGDVPFMCLALGRLKMSRAAEEDVGVCVRMARLYIDSMLEDHGTLRSWLWSRRYAHTAQDCHQWWTDHIDAMEDWLNDPTEH